jgi:hypothetical protein
MPHQQFFLGRSIQSFFPRVTAPPSEKTVEPPRQDKPYAASPPDALNHTLFQQILKPVP